MVLEPDAGGLLPTKQVCRNESIGDSRISFIVCAATVGMSGRLNKNAYSTIDLSAQQRAEGYKYGKESIYNRSDRAGWFLSVGILIGERIRGTWYDPPLFRGLQGAYCPFGGESSFSPALWGLIGFHEPDAGYRIGSSGRDL